VNVHDRGCSMCSGLYGIPGVSAGTTKRSAVWWWIWLDHLQPLLPQRSPAVSGQVLTQDRPAPLAAATWVHGYAREHPTWRLR
ncbi:MAG: hypothetical protein M1115_02265, partial [Actinobacteria bacterium]|nr:hypothetical protein [Actinomycetota bacterium]